MFQSFKVSVSS